jgi:hypothetical protein
MAATPTARDWDSQSLHTNSTTAAAVGGALSGPNLFLPPAGAGGSGGGCSPGVTIEYIRIGAQAHHYADLVHDRYV